MKKHIILILLLAAAILFTGCRAKTSPLAGTQDPLGPAQEAETPAPNAAEETSPEEGIYVSVRPNCEPSYGVSLLLPKGWTYEAVQSDDDPTSDLAVSIRPENAKGECVISVSYMRGFGVCGTGLVQKDILFNGFEARQGFYDGSALWSFICLKDPMDCVIINSAETWYSEYEKEIDQILSTVRFTWYGENVDASKYVGDPIVRASLDLDGDGRIEDCVLSDGPTSGLFTVVFKVSRDGELLYCNTFNLSAGVLSLEEKDGIPYLVLERYRAGEEPVIEHHKISVEGNRIVIEELGEFEGYWGDENWNFDLREGSK